MTFSANSPQIHHSQACLFMIGGGGCQTLGRIQGTVFTIAGVFNLLQYALVSIVQGPLDGNPFWVNVGQLAAIGPLVVLVEVLRRHKPAASALEPADEWSGDDESPSLSRRLTPPRSPASVPLPPKERAFLARSCSNSGSPSLAASNWGKARNVFHAINVLNCD